jgi:hypothetical protein
MKWKPVYLPPELKDRLKRLAESRGQSIPELLEELLTGSLEPKHDFTICKAKPIDAKNMLGLEVKTYYVVCQDPSGHTYKALIPNLSDFVAKLRLPVVLEE